MSLSEVGYTEAQLELVARIYFAEKEKSFAPYLMGSWFDAFLLGCLSIMYVEWGRRGYRTEKTLTKVLLIYLLIVNIGISCFILTVQMSLFATGFGVCKNFLDPKYYRIFWLLDVVSRVPAATYFSHRAWLISRKSILVPLSVIPLMIASVGCAIAAYCTSVTLPIRLDSPERILVTVFTCTEVAVDLINTVTIAIGLYRSRTGWQNTDRIISRLLIMLAETQLPPTIAVTSFLICFLGWPNQTIIAAWTGMAKIHVLCLVVVINSRIKVNGAYGNEESHEMPSSLQVSVDRQTHTEEDESDMPITPVYSSFDQNGQLRTVNGRRVGQEGVDHYKLMTSKSSLVSTV